ncbi:uncharacterized protein LOC111639231 isoform X2 [Centruroides sculpturatus]|uniref:uncharacterized protein LOC111639231 isoform X2 n=1 Tax=Centruroides sculpturatus TaxID=218467 RepID=UPI000C6D567D|nr:uncharacterized protein LOC111639231 isoform X2 [Centruroides sculpturatus]
MRRGKEKRCRKRVFAARQHDHTSGKRKSLYISAQAQNIQDGGRRRRRRFDRRFWIREIFLDRERTGVQNTLIPRLRSFDKEYYFDFLRMSPEKFDELLNKLGPKITRQNTRWRDAIPASDRLAVTLR